MPGPGIKDDVHTLAKALRHRDRFIRRHAAAALTTLGAGAAPALAQLGLALEDADAELACRAARALAALGPVAVETLAAGLRHPSAAVRREAVWGLKDMGRAARSALPALRDALRDPDVRVHLGAAQAIGGIGRDAGSKAVMGLIDALRGNNLILCRLAAQALIAIGRAALPALRELLKVADPHVCREALWAVRSIEGAEQAAPAAAMTGDSSTQIIPCHAGRASQVRTALVPSCE